MKYLPVIAAQKKLLLVLSVLVLSGCFGSSKPKPGDPYYAPTISAAQAMPQLRGMKGLEEYWIEINRLENAGDKSYRHILAKLFSGQYEALEVLKLKDIVDSLEDAVDAFEKVANIIEQIHAKES